MTTPIKMTTLAIATAPGQYKLRRHPYTAGHEHMAPPSADIRTRRIGKTKERVAGTAEIAPITARTGETANTL